MAGIDELFGGTQEKAVNYQPTDFDRQAWLDKKKESRNDAFEMLEVGTQNLNQPACLQAYLDVQSRFNFYSVSNAILIAHQRPSAMQLADAKTWREKGVIIQKGEKGISMLGPAREFTRPDGSKGVSYDVRKMFDVSQTTLEPKEQEPREVSPRALIERLLKTSPVSVLINDRLPKDVQALFVPQDNSIYVQQGLPGDVAFRVLTQEIAKARGYASTRAPEDNTFFAQCVSYMLCRRCGIEPTPPTEKDALQGLASKDIRAVMKDIREEVNNIVNTMDRPKEPVEREEAR